MTETLRTRIEVEPEVEAAVQAEATTSHHKNGVEDTLCAVGHVAATGNSLTESPDSAPTQTTPRYFRDHTNPYTMEMPASWGSNRRT